MIASLVCVAVGCGGRAQGKVEGKVTFEGQPVTDATIQFQSPTTGAAAGARLDPKGAYKLDDSLPVGEYNVIVVPFDDLGPGAAPSTKPKEHADIPSKYRAAKTSGLSFKVSSGMNTFDVNMTAGK